jgi:hypothetical protein
MPRRTPRRTRQAAEGEVEETELAVYEHGAEAADEVADELRDGIRDMVVCELDPETAWQLRWSAAGFPTIMDASILTADSHFLALDRELQRALLSDESTQTAVERGDWILPAIRVKRARGALATVDELAAVFDQCVGPASLEASTRRGYQAAWCTVLTWGIAHQAVGQLMPMNKVTLKALTQELLMVGCAAGTIKNVWCSISDRHRRFGQDAPLAAAGDFKRLYKAVAAIKGAPSKLLFPIGIHHLRRLLDLIGLTECQSRDVLVCSTGMALCCRVGSSGTSLIGSGGTRNGMGCGWMLSAPRRSIPVQGAATALPFSSLWAVEVRVNRSGFPCPASRSLTRCAKAWS